MKLNNPIKIVSLLLVSVSTLILFNPVIADGNHEHDTPKVPFRHGVGKQLFQATCAECHGTWAEGTQKGPPLIHPFYKPSHHSDAAFYRAALKGVQAHHWKFGNMAPVKDVTRKDMDAIVPFIRWLQQEKGLF